MSGKRGDGKSFDAITLACALDHTFDIDRVVFGLDEFLELVERLPPKSFIVADEIGEWFGSRNWMKQENKDLSDLLQIFRICQLGVIYTVPLMYQVDKNLRTMGDVFIKALRVDHNKHLGEAKYFDIEIDPIRGKKPYTKQPVIRGPDGYKKKVTKVYFDRPPLGIMRKYKKKKAEFTKNIITEKRAATQRRGGKVDGEESEGKPAKCNKCGYGWSTRSRVMKPACPNCRSRNTTTEL